jgi:ATP-dependent RNA helicase HelY
LLQSLGYLSDARLTDSGRLLSRIWSESDLVVAQCLRSGAWDGLSAADLAAAVSVLVFAARQDVTSAPRMPSAAAAQAIADTVRVWAEVAGLERDGGLPTTREPDLGFAAAIAAWADGATLTQTLDIAAGSGAELSAGDFVRWCRQVIDLLDQLATGSGEITATAREAVGLLRRGVVSLGST